MLIADASRFRWENCNESFARDFSVARAIKRLQPIPKGMDVMRRVHHMHRQELMNPDKFSDIILIVVVVLLVALLFGLIRDLAILKTLSAWPHLVPN